MAKVPRDRSFDSTRALLFPEGYEFITNRCRRYQSDLFAKLCDSDAGLGLFVDEIRRYYPFIPLIGGRVLSQFTWRDHTFKKKDWVLFDLYGTNHDPRIWADPQTFRPERFSQRDIGLYDLVSHGAGDRRVTHRCPGEWITVEQMKAIIRVMTREMSYEVPSQDLNINLARIPALPSSGFVIKKIRLTAT